MFQKWVRGIRMNSNTSQLQVRRLRSSLCFTILTCWYQTACVAQNQLFHVKLKKKIHTVLSYFSGAHFQNRGPGGGENERGGGE